MVGLVIPLVGMLAVGGWLAASSWCWPLWIVVGMAAGAAAGSGRHIWLVGLAALAFYPISAWLGLPASTVTRVHWIILTIVGAALVASGYALGTLAWWRPRGNARPGGVPRARPAGVRLVVGAVVLGLLGVGSWSGYSGVVGAEEMVNPTGIASTSVRIGTDLTSIDPVRTIAQVGDRPVLLLHGTADMLDRPERSAERTVEAARQAGVPVLLHYCDGATHGAVIDRCPEQWASWVDDFLRPLATR